MRGDVMLNGSFTLYGEYGTVGRFWDAFATNGFHMERWFGGPDSRACCDVVLGTIAQIPRC